MCTNILNDLAVVNYVPFDSDTIGNPALDVGDILSFSGGQADATKYACITSNSIKIGGRQSIKCVGKNPKLSQAKSKNDKNISGLLAQIEAGKIGIHTFTNASAFTVADVDTKIISIEFATTEANHAQFFGQVIVDVTAQPVTRSVTASGDVVIPSVNVDGIPVDPEDPEEEPVVIGSTEEQTITVSLPMSWQEDGHADVIFSFEFNNQMIPVHYPQENWHSEGTRSFCIIRSRMWCRTIRISSTSICGAWAARLRWIPGCVLRPFPARAWVLLRHGMAGSILKSMLTCSESAMAVRTDGFR